MKIPYLLLLIVNLLHLIVSSENRNLYSDVIVLYNSLWCTEFIMATCIEMISSFIIIY
jgi:hypothetical protein